MGGPQTEPFLLHPADLLVDDLPLVGAPAVHGQLQRWAKALAVAEPVSGSVDEDKELPEPRGLRWVAAWQGVLGALMLLLGLVVAVAAVAGITAELPSELVEEAALVAALLVGVASVGLASAYGIWRRRRWAWMLTLVLQGFNVLQLLLALASGGFTGVVQFGLLSAVAAIAIFYYLTRPRVAAVFGRRRGTYSGNM
jgi:hypothetical protein